MDKKLGRPHEGVAQRNDGLDGISHRDDGTTDTEGHGLVNTLPGTGGDFSPRKPSSGGELIDDKDVEGHNITDRGPGTGGDFSPRKPSSGGELIDDYDVEGHSR
jgi:hypothetical protein